MNTTELVALLALTGFAIYKQTQTSQVTDRGRFKMAITYAVIGIAVGGFALPTGALAWALLALSFGLSAVVGLYRGRLTPMWVEGGHVWRKGNALTVSLFLALVAVKFGLGTVAYLTHVHDGAGFGEVLVMIAIMIAVQAEIVRGRAAALTAGRPAVPADDHQSVGV
jgi:hypothetical protein